MFSNDLVCNIIEYLNNNINKEITIDELSLLFYFDKAYIMRRFKKELNISIHEYINTMKNQMRQNSKTVRRNAEELKRKRSKWNEILEHGSVFQIADNYLSIL